MQTTSISIGAIRALVLAAVLAVLSPRALAQAAPDGRAIIEQASRAIEQVESLTARMTLAGGGSKNFMQFMPSGEGVFRAQRVENEDGERVWATRIVGAGKDRGDGEEYTFDAATRGDTVTWVEHRSKSVNTNSRARARGVGLSMRQQMNLDELLGADPLARELDAVSVELQNRETIGGVECDVVLITYAKDQQSATSRGQARANKAKWFLGVEDNLPRRIERITDADIIAISLILTLEDMRIDAEIAPEDLEVNIPDGYKKIEPRTATGPVRTGVKGAGVRRGENVKATPRPPSRARAASFSVEDASGETVSNETQQGRISVIFFWGTWSVPSRDYAPLISGLAETFAGEAVDVLAPVVRSDPGKAKAMINSNAYRQRLLVDADAMARSFRVRVYPTIFILDAQGGVVATETPAKGSDTPEQVIERVEQLVRDELARTNDG